MDQIPKSIGLFLVAGLCGIGGGYLIWQWWRNGAPAVVGALSILWGAVVDGIRPDRFDLLGAAVCLAGVAIIMYAPRRGDGLRTARSR